MMTIDEAIKHCEEVAERLESKNGYAYTDVTCEECAKEHRQLAEWLRELKKYRAIFEKVGKILADNGYTMDDLDNIFGKLNEEVNAESDKGVLEKINEKQDSLRATCKAWDEAISRDGYVN